MGDLFDWAKTANAISVGQIPDWMLEGYRTKPQGQGEPRRHMIQGGPAFESKGTYHKDGQPLAFADVFEQPDRVNIGYMSTAPEYRGQGHGSALMQHVYDSYPDKKIVWGQRFHDAADAMYNKYKTNPRTAAAGPELAQNWVFLNDNIATGVQPHHLLVHRVEGAGGLDGDPILGQLGNTWLAGNGLPQGLEHDVARGTFDKKGRPQIWESNIDRNYVIDKLMEHRQAHPKMAARAEQNTYALLSRKGGDDAPWNIDSTHATLEEAQEAQADPAQRLVMFPRGEEIHPFSYYQRISAIRPVRERDAIYNSMGDYVRLEQEYPDDQAVNSFDENGSLKGTVVYRVLDDTTVWVPSIFATTTEAAMELFSYMKQTFPGKQLEGEFVNEELGKVADRYNRSLGFTPWTEDARRDQSGYVTVGYVTAGIVEDMQRRKDEAAKFNGQRFYMPSLVWMTENGLATECPNLPGTYDINEALASIRNAQPNTPGLSPFGYIDSYIQGGDPVATHQREHVVGQKPREYRGSYAPTETVEEMYAKVQGMGWDVVSEGPKGDHYFVTIRNPQGGQNERIGDTRELAYTAALTWAWQHSHFAKESMDETGRYQIIGADGDVVNDAAPDEWHAIEWAKDITRTAEPDQYNSFEVWDTVEEKSIAHFRTDEHGTQPGEWVPPYNPYSSSSRRNMDLPVTPKKTLGQVFATLRPSPADGNHLGIQAHTLGYTKVELETFLEGQEDGGTPRGWKTFKDAAYVAYSSRGWKVQAAFTLELYEAPNEDGQSGGMVKQDVQNDGVEQAKQNALQQLQSGQIYRARLVDPMTGRKVWDTDDEWRNENAPDASKWQQGQIIPVEQDWAFSTRPAA